jgi:hypothetical protein
LVAARHAARILQRDAKHVAANFADADLVSILPATRRRVQRAVSYSIAR